MTFPNNRFAKAYDEQILYDDQATWFLAIEFLTAYDHSAPEEKTVLQSVVDMMPKQFQKYFATVNPEIRDEIDSIDIPAAKKA